MASLDKGKLISKLGYIAYFNERVWLNILNTAGQKVYHKGSTITLNKDKITNITMDETGKATETGKSNITIQGTPKFNSVAFTGSNTTTGAVFYDKPDAIRAEHLKTLNPNDKQYFTLSAEDLDNKANSLGYSPNLVVADVLYACCFDIIRRLISIRPFTASWSHESSVSNKVINEKFNGGKYSYGVFIDNPVVDPTWIKNTGSGSWGQGGRLSRWQITLGGNISSLNLTETSVARNGVYVGSIAFADRTVNMVTKFWEAWANRCKESNKFDYKFFSCHLNCHSSCHSSCHGSRSRR